MFYMNVFRSVALSAPGSMHLLRPMMIDVIAARPSAYYGTLVYTVSTFGCHSIVSFLHGMMSQVRQFHPHSKI